MSIDEDSPFEKVGAETGQPLPNPFTLGLAMMMACNPWLRYWL